MLGPPEGYLPLAEMTIYLATAPKSNSAKAALAAAMAAAQETPAAPVPLHIRNAPTGLMKELGYGKGYRYAHDSPDAYLPQEYLPDQLRGTTLYQPGSFGYEKKVAERLAWWERKKAEADESGSGDASDAAGAE
jgi:putative ATPase